MKDFYLGLDVGGTKCAVILGRCGDTMEIIDRIAFPTEAKKGFDHTIENIYAAIDEMMARHSLSADNVQALGISCGGPLNSKTGRVLSPPNLFGWDDIPIVELMETRYGIPTALQNDANACALAEWRFGAARGFENVIFCTFGTGMGSGLILDGRLYEGTTGMAGEIGHLRLSEHGPVGFGKEGSFEGFCSGGGIAQLARTKVLQALQMGQRPSFCPDVQLLDTLSAKSVAGAAHAGDDQVHDYRYSGNSDYGLSNVFQFLNSCEDDLYDPTHEFDEPPGVLTRPGERLGEYLRHPGFLNEFQDYEIESLSGRVNLPTVANIFGANGEPRFMLFNRKGYRGKPTTDLVYGRYGHGLEESSYCEYWAIDETCRSGRQYFVGRDGSMRSTYADHVSGLRPKCAIRPELEVELIDDGLYRIVPFKATKSHGPQIATDEELLNLMGLL